MTIQIMKTKTAKTVNSMVRDLVAAPTLTMRAAN